MARLNEPPIAPAATTATSLVNGVGGGGESIEVLKRRFIRQNRELAKNNSSQSLRIRSLELEISKLLSDNLELREQVFNLQNEVYNARVQSSSSAARKLKARFQAQIAQLAELVDGIDEADTDGMERLVPEQRERVLSPSRREYRDRQPLAELMRDAQMPTIAENKSFPRSTLDPEQINEVRLSAGSGSQGSPELGPPPVAHFDELGSQESVPQEIDNDESPKIAEDELLPSINLETRRRRKGEPGRRSSILPQTMDYAEPEKPTSMLRTGAKRKLADREAEKPINPPAQGDFSFSRKSSAENSGSEAERVAIKKEPEPAVEEVSERPASPTKPGRKVLGDKNTNASPRKPVSVSAKSLKDDLKKPAPPKLACTSNRPSSRGSRRASPVDLPPPVEDPVKTAEVRLAEPEAELAPSESENLPPETPAAPIEDVFSPPPSHPSTGPGINISRHGTPPPAEMSSASNTTEGSQRPSRRARSAVNYAEPSLMAKMRRPDKKMVDAISGLQDPRRTMSTSSRSSMDRRTSTEIPASAERSISVGGAKRTVTGAVKIKTEPMDDDDWSRPSHTGDMARESLANPLHRRTASFSADLPSQSPLRHSPTRSTAAADSDTISLAPRPAPGISTLIAQSRKRREAMDAREAERKSSSSPLPSDDSVAAAAKKMEELELYDFKDSSSPQAEEGAAAKVSSRRKSTMATSAAEKSVATTSAAARGGSRRRSMMV